MKKFLDMTPDEAHQWEADQDNSNDIYKVAARVKNLARAGGGSLTAVGEALCNTHVHVLMDLYGFAEGLPEPHRTDLLEVVRKHENMPATLLAAVKPGAKR